MLSVNPRLFSIRAMHSYLQEAFGNQVTNLNMQKTKLSSPDYLLFQNGEKRSQKIMTNHKEKKG